jgi:predicted NodU family carbamoyl transferase
LTALNAPVPDLSFDAMHRSGPVLGISDHYISGAGVVHNGGLVSAVAAERLARMKMVMDFPRLAIAEALRIARVVPGQLERIAIASQWGYFLNEYVNFSNGVFGVDEGIVRRIDTMLVR